MMKAKSFTFLEIEIVQYAAATIYYMLSTTKKLQEIMELYQLTQLIDSPTRITNSSQSLLDVANN